MNSKDWRERFLDNLPFRMDDIMIVNMPEAPVKVQGMLTKQLSFDDLQGQIFVFAGYLKPGRHQLIIRDAQSDTFWAKNIIVDLRKGDPILGK